MSQDWHLTILRSATHETERGDHDLCLSRSQYTDTDPTSRERAATVGIEPRTSSPGVGRSTDWVTAPPPPPPTHTHTGFGPAFSVLLVLYVFKVLLVIMIFFFYPFSIPFFLFLSFLTFHCTCISFSYTSPDFWIILYSTNCQSPLWNRLQFVYVVNF